MSNRAVSAEDDEESIGQISDGEEPEIETTEGDGLRRLPSEEAPHLVGESGEEEGGPGEDGGGGEDSESGDENIEPGEEAEEEAEDSQSSESGGGDEGIDPLDDDSDQSVLLSEIDESHGAHPGSCKFVCFNDYRIDCECECERCMFQYYNQVPQDEERFNELLRQNFRSSPWLSDPEQRHFRARRPYDYAQQSNTQSCTQMIPWGVDISNWTEPCPHTHQSRYNGRILPCDEIFCGSDLKALNDEYEESAGQGLPNGLWDEDGKPIRPYVCETHIEDSKTYFHMGQNLDNLYNAHLIRYCKVHEAELLAEHRGDPDGATTCTCRNVDFTRWQCRSCFQTKVEKLQRHFRHRVNPRWRGNADTNITDDDFYQRDWKAVRRMLQRRHPCVKGQCGRPRLKGLVRNQVLDCRCCGGYIVKPLRRSARLKGRAGVVYSERRARGRSA